MIDLEEDLITRLKKRAEIRRQISTRKSVQENKPDRIADLLEEAAIEIEKLQADSNFLQCLDAAGVDNWDGYDYAQEMHQEQYPSEDD